MTLVEQLLLELNQVSEQISKATELRELQRLYARGTALFARLNRHGALRDPDAA
jgi:hypothetical protein